MPLSRREFLKLGSAAAITALALPRLLHAAPVEIPVLMYHDFADSFKDDYTVSPSCFAAQMEWLYANGYRAIFLQDIARLSGNEEKTVILTFDDGYASFQDYAFPLLREYGFKAHINIIGKYVGSFMDFGGNRPLLSWDEYRYLLRSGLVSLGCHSHNLHTKRGVLSVPADMLKEDLALFQETFRKETGSACEVLAWPFGVYNAAAIKIAMNLGFRYLLTSNEGRLDVRGPLDEIPRLYISKRLDLISFKQYLGEKQ
jgi:peptidoglycan/xylan/chitin deacetylase (PgdA/CDA1 family)